MGAAYQEWTPAWGNIRVHKVAGTAAVNGDSKFSLSGATYSVYKSDGTTGTGAYILTGGNGTGTLKKWTSNSPNASDPDMFLDPGTYVVKERSVSKGYKKDPIAYKLTVKNGQTAEFYSVEAPEPVKLKLVKQPEDGNQQDSIAGATYGLWAARAGIGDGEDETEGTEDDVLWGVNASADDMTGLYEISLQAEGTLVVDLRGGAVSATAGKWVELWTPNQTDAQRWFIEKAQGGGYHITGVTSGLRVSLEGDPANKVKTVVAAPSDTDPKQVWDFTPVSGKKNVYTIRNHAKPTFVLDVPNGEPNRGLQLQVYTANGTSSQEWYLKNMFVGKVSCGEDGAMEFSGLMPNTEYYARELSAPTNGAYKMNYEVVPIKTGTLGATTAEAIVKDEHDQKEGNWKPTVGTTATADNKHELQVPDTETVTIKDVVTCKFTVTAPAEIPEGGFTLTGTLMDKATKQPLLVDGNPVTQTADVTPSKLNATSSKKVTMNFTVPVAAVKGKTVVVYEKLEHKTDSSAPVAKHENINDAKQTVSFVDIHTTATDSKTGTHEGDANSSRTVTITDVVKYENLTVGKTYTLTGTLTDKATGKPLMNGEDPITASQDFVAQEASGEVTVSFSVPASLLLGKEVVAFETLERDGVEVAIHADVNDKNQTVSYPKIQTTATEAESGSHMANVTETLDINDVVEYSNLKPGQAYTLTGTLMDKGTGEPVSVEGKPVTATQTFTPDAADGSVTMQFSVPASAIKSDGVVVFESLADASKKVVATHEDISDEGQTVELYRPGIGTTLTTADAVKSFVKEDGVETIDLEDIVSYKGLAVNQEYTLSGGLHLRKNGEDAGKIEGTDASVKFTPKKSNGIVKVKMTLPMSVVDDNVEIVAFETLSYNGETIATHKVITDEGQTVRAYQPTIGTSLATQDGTKDILASDGEVTLVDTVSYEGLLPGQRYELRGALHAKTDGRDAGVVEGTDTTVDFVPEQASGTTQVSFTVDLSKIDGQGLVAYEQLYYNRTLIASHEDINDEGQTVKLYRPSIGTKLTAKDGTKKVVAGAGAVTLVDTVSYEALVPGQKYELRGVLHAKADGKDTGAIDGTSVTAEFTPEQASGTTQISFTVDLSKVDGQALVAYEQLYLNGNLIASHEDISDEGQTIETYNPRIKTSLADQGESKDVTATTGPITLVDTVAYENLVPGQKYELHGVLHAKADGQDAGAIAGAEATVEFTPESESDTVEVLITIDLSNLETQELVAYERLSLNGSIIASHEDIDDEAQTIKVHHPNIGTSLADENGEKEVLAGTEQIALIDTVSYEDLIPGRKYEMRGVLHGKKDGQDAGAIAGTETSVEFTPEQASGTISIPIIVNLSQVDSPELVAFEQLYLNGSMIASHEDISDEGQTVRVYCPGIGTKLTDQSGAKEVLAGSTQVTLVDTVSYNGLIPGRKYEVRGVLHAKADGQDAGAIDGTETAIEFTPEKESGTVSVPITIDLTKVDSHELVAYEWLYLNGNVITSHEDINDEGQTIKVRRPQIGTTLTTEDGKKSLPERQTGTVTLVDTVEFHDLIPGREYELRGTLRVKDGSATGRAVDGAVGATKFTPKTADGRVTVKIVVDLSKAKTRSMVAFEQLLLEGKVIASHEDINDRNQTIADTGQASDLVRTGNDRMPAAITVGAAIASLLSTGILVHFSRRQRR